MKTTQTHNPKPAILLWLLFVLFIFYGTLIPFDLSLDPQNLKANLQQTNLTPFFDKTGFVSRMDIVSNLLLFMAYGVLFYLAFVPSLHTPCRPGLNLVYRVETKRVRVRGNIWIFPLCVMTSFALSGLVEMLQFLSPSRMCSITDVIVNTIGGAIGCITGWFFYKLYRQGLSTWTRAMLNNRPILLVLLVYSAILFLNFLIPFNVSIQVSDIGYSIKNANLIPFANYQDLQHYFIGAGPELALYLILGFLITLCLISYTRISRFIASIYTIILTAVFAIVIETAQIFFISRVTDATDIVTAILGAILGTLGCALLNKKKLLVALFILFILYCSFSPFTFTATPDSLGIKNFIPFHAHWEHTTIWTFTDFIEAMILYLFLGFLISLNSKTKKNSLILYFLFGLTLGLLIEFSQLFIITRHFDVTDVLLVGIATFFGARLPLSHPHPYLCRPGLNLVYRGGMRKDRAWREGRVRKI